MSTCAINVSGPPDSSVSPPDKVPGKDMLSVQAQGGDPPDVLEGECLFIAELFKGYADTLNPVEAEVVNNISSCSMLYVPI